MNKLLHERLRELDCDGYCVIENDDGYVTVVTSVEAKHLADEIERYYIPRPRDNKDIPFVEGDIVYSVDPDTEYSAEIVRVKDSILYVCWEDGLYDWVDACDMQHEKPQFKVFDADGVEIKEGERLYGVNTDSRKAQVESVYPAGAVDKWGNRHDKPFVHYTEDYGTGKEWDYADNLTHKEPDSLEKLRDDMVLDASADGAAISSSRLGVFATRLSALIDRGA